MIQARSMTIYLPGTVYFLISSKNCESGLLSFSSSLLLSTEHFFTLLGNGGLTVDVDVELELFFATFFANCLPEDT